MSSLIHSANLSEAYSLSQTQVKSFQQDGHIFLPQVASKSEIAVYRPLIVASVDRLDHESQRLEQIAAGRQNGWRFVHNLWERDRSVREFVLAQRFAKIAAELLEVPTVRLLRDESYFKDPGGIPTPWHQDCDFFPLNTHRVVSMWIALNDISLEMAPLTFATGSHRGGYLEPMGEELQFGLSAQSLSQRGFSIANPKPLQAGDATFHAGWTLHSSDANRSDRMREALVIVYYAEGALVSLPERKEQSNYLQGCPKQLIRQEHLNQCFPGLKPGDLAASSKNPIVYSKEVIS
jgi:ectoine hydroxylase-related dioxygenase (phytanoyl-CoA dioxygenase family)